MGNKIFEKVQNRRPQMSAFDLSHEKKLSMKMGDLVPIYLQEIIPGDQFSVNTEVMMRLAPMLAPVMHRVNCYVHYFFVPNRLLYSEWEDFITGGQDGTLGGALPTIGLGGTFAAKGSLADYFGLPIGATEFSPYQVNPLPFAAYAKIWSDYYRDPNLMDELDVPALVVSDSPEIKALRKRCWEKDYFTSALPWPQRGPAVTLPPGTFEPQYLNISRVVDENGFPITLAEQLGSEDGNLIADNAEAAIRNLQTPQNVDLNISINELRRSSALQRWLEKQARGGARYVETILSHFGIKSSDARLQRAEYLGGGRQPVVISEVLNTTGTTEAPQGTMAGHGISTGAKNRFRSTFEEHGYVIGIMSVLPRTAYQQGIHRTFLRSEKMDFYWPEFANLGEQEVYNQELYWTDGDDETNIATFGYQQRYAEMKYMCDSVHGDFRDNLDFWHMGRKFDQLPNLNGNFVESDPTTRIFAVEDGTDQLWVQLYNNVKARRPIPYFADPRLT